MNEQPNQPGNGGNAMHAVPTYAPPTDIIASADRVTMYMDVPGVDPDSLDVTLDRRVLSVTARVVSSIPPGYAPVHLEFRDGNYERRFAFSDDMDGDHIDATLKDGVLRLDIPKRQDVPRRKVVVKSA